MVVPLIERLILRRLQRDDLAPLFALHREADVRRYFPEKTLTLEQTRGELDRFLNGRPRNPQLGLWPTIERSTGSFLGRCGLLPWTIDGRQEVELAFLIDRRRRGKGFATKAAKGISEHARERPRLQRAICLIMPGNLAATRVVRKAGMAFERDYKDEFGPSEIWARFLCQRGVRGQDLPWALDGYLPPNET